MAEETRKDPRAKVLSMTVRYKSANVEEFIENHAHDVSRLGIFIKTASPFPPGTLLKFEIRIQDEKTVLSGVGRVIWKRDSDAASDEAPAGMGVKFIKKDEATDAMIQRLVDKHGDKVNAYDAGKPAGSADDGDAPAASAPSGSSATPAPAKASPRGATMLGLGTVGAAAKASGKPPAEEKKPEASGGGGMFFPTTDPGSEMPPPEERTVMRQAAELLKQALAGTGSSLDEIGGKIELAKEEPKVEDKPAEAAPVEAKKAEEPKAEEPKAEEPKAEEPKAEEKAEEPKAEEKVAAKAEEPEEKVEEKKPVAANSFFINILC